MKKLFFLLFALILTSGSYAQTKVVIEAKNYQNTKINLAWKEKGKDYSVNSIELTNGKGEITFNVPTGTNLSLASLDPRSSIMAGRGIMPGPSFAFYAEPGTITISFDADIWPVLTITGGNLSKDCNKYWSQIGPIENSSFELTKKRMSNIGADEGANSKIEEQKAKLAEQKREINNKFINDNPNSLLSLDLLAGQFLKLSLEEFTKKFNQLSSSVRGSAKGVEIQEKINIATATMPGQKAPAFSKLDKEGNRVTLESYKGKYLLIDFWGTWCVPCRNSHPHLVQLYNKYSPMGLEFLNVAQEGNIRNKDKWLKAIEDDGLVWTQILNDLDIDKCDMVKLFSIQAFPSKVLIDKEGKIIATWIGDTPEVDAKLKEIFGK